MSFPGRTMVLVRKVFKRLTAMAPALVALKFPMNLSKLIVPKSKFCLMRLGRKVCDGGAQVFGFCLAERYHHRGLRLGDFVGKELCKHLSTKKKKERAWHGATRRLQSRRIIKLLEHARFIPSPAASRARARARRSAWRCRRAGASAAASPAVCARAPGRSPAGAGTRRR